MVLVDEREEDAEDGVGFVLRDADDPLGELRDPTPRSAPAPGSMRWEVKRTPGLTKTLFQPVTGLTRMTGWMAERSSPLLMGEPRSMSRNCWLDCLLATWKKLPSCRAERPSRNLANLGLRRS